jgi:hypothetical protein
MEMTPHRGITMHRIPVEGGAGLLYVLGTIVVFLLALPQLAPLAALGLAGGALLAPALYRWRTRSLTSLRGGLALFAVGAVLFVGLGNEVLFRVLAVTALVAGTLFAEVLLRRSPSHPSIASH